MEENKKRHWPWIILAIVLGLLLLCAIGVIAGAAGYLMGRQTAVLSGAQMQQEAPDRWQVPAIPLPPTLTPNLAPAPPWRQQRTGALVVSVVVGSPANSAGIRTGDIIYQVDGQPLDAEHNLVALIAEHEPGDVVLLSVWRENRMQDIKVQLGRHPDRAGETPWLGVEYRAAPLPPTMQSD